jgi:hypothetical protein|tara:strand:+ start:27809 stop:27958 length:150 start_codon:yes stop_codon:yes gene_type:complete
MFHNHLLFKGFVWNIDTIKDFKDILALSVDGIGSNKPKLLIDYLKNKKI